MFKKYFVSVITILIRWLKKFYSSQKTTTATKAATTATAHSSRYSRKESFFITALSNLSNFIRHLIKSTKRRIPKLLTPKIKTQVAYPGKKLSTCLNVKTKVNSNINMTWYTMQIALIRHAENIKLVRMVGEFQRA